MERDRTFYRPTGRDFPNKVLLALGFIGLPVVFAWAAYFWLKKGDKTAKRKAAIAASQRVKKGIFIRWKTFINRNRND